MSNHTCPRCGYESHCSHGSWPDRHPVSATTGALFAMVFMSLMLSSFPFAGWSIVGLCVGGYVWLRIDRERDRREGLAKRADWEHRRLMEQAVPVREIESRRKSRPRGVSHFAVTEPMRSSR